MNAELEIHLGHWQALGVIGLYILAGIVVAGLLCRFLDWHFNDDGDEIVMLTAMVMLWPLLILFSAAFGVCQGIRFVIARIAGWTN